MSSKKTSVPNVPKMNNNINTKRMKVISRQRVRTFDSPIVYAIEYLTISKYVEQRPPGYVYTSPPFAYAMCHLRRIINPKIPTLRQAVLDYKWPIFNIDANTGSNN